MEGSKEVGGFVSIFHKSCLHRKVGWYLWVTTCARSVFVCVCVCVCLFCVLNVALNGLVL